MARPLSLNDLYNVRSVLSEAFNDSYVDYAYIAQKVEGFEPEQIKDILYSQVAVVCHYNLECAVPPIWTGFDPDSLNTEIELMLLATRRSWIRRQMHKVHTAWLRYAYKYVWEDINAHFIDLD